MRELYQYYSHKHKLRMWNIPKNASTSVKAYLGMGNMDYQAHSHIKNNGGLSHIKEYPLFAIVRNPIDRWFSTYKYLSSVFMNGIDYDVYLRLCRNVIEKGQSLYDFNNHIVKQSEYFNRETPDFVIPIHYLDLVFTDIPVTNSTSNVKTGILKMPDDIIQYFEDDFTLWNYYKHFNDWEDLKKHINE